VSLRVVPVTFDTACRFVEMWHRHHAPPVGCKFCQGVADDKDVLRGVAITGRPVSRVFDDGQSLEVTRSATDGTPNANSKLYGAAWNAAKALGYGRLVTYTHTAFMGPVCEMPCDHESCLLIRLGESGASLRAAGWVIVAQRPARRGWNTPSRPRELTGTEGIPRTLWEAS
jgi:hypothetical protein